MGWTICVICQRDTAEQLNFSFSSNDSIHWTTYQDFLILERRSKDFWDASEIWQWRSWTAEREKEGIMAGVVSEAILSLQTAKAEAKGKKKLMTMMLRELLGFW